MVMSFFAFCCGFSVSLQQQQNVLNNNGTKPPSSRREKETRREKTERKSESSHDAGESKENQQAQPTPLGELPKDGESKLGQDTNSVALKKRGGESVEFFSVGEACLIPSFKWSG